jgi:hypothetical protein
MVGNPQSTSFEAEWLPTSEAITITLTCGHMRSGPMRSISIAVLTVTMAMPSAADELPVRLKQAPGLDKVEANCAACHSLDYIPMNSPFLNAAGWDAEVTKMINAFGAPIDPVNAKVIADYLKENYGMPSMAPSPVSAPRAEVPVPMPRPRPRPR